MIKPHHIQIQRDITTNYNGTGNIHHRQLYIHVSTNTNTQLSSIQQTDIHQCFERSTKKIRRDDPGDVEGERSMKKIPAKIMWYAPIIPRLKRLLKNKDHAKLLRWHK